MDFEVWTPETNIPPPPDAQAGVWTPESKIPPPPDYTAEKPVAGILSPEEDATLWKMASLNSPIPEKWSDRRKQRYADYQRAHEYARRALTEHGRETGGDWGVAKETPAELRPLVLQAVQEISQREKPSGSQSYANKVVGGITRSGYRAAEGVASLVEKAIPGGLDEGQEAFLRQIRGTAEGADPVTTGSAWDPRTWPIKAAEMVPSIVGAGRVGSLAQKGLLKAGVGRTAAAIAGSAGGAGLIFGPGMYESTYDSLVKDGVDKGTARWAAAASATLGTALFAGLPHAIGFTGKAAENAPVTIARALSKWAKHTASGTGLMTAQASQEAVIEEIAKSVAGKSEGEVEAAKNILRKTWTGVETAGPMAILAAPGAFARGGTGSRNEVQRLNQPSVVAAWVELNPERARALAENDTPSRTQWRRDAGLPSGVNEEGRKAFADQVRQYQRVAAQAQEPSIGSRLEEWQQGEQVQEKWQGRRFATKGLEQLRERVSAGDPLAVEEAETVFREWYADPTNAETWAKENPEAARELVQGGRYTNAAFHNVDPNLPAIEDAKVRGQWYKRVKDAVAEMPAEAQPEPAAPGPGWKRLEPGQEIPEEVLRNPRFVSVDLPSGRWYQFLKEDSNAKRVEEASSPDGGGGPQPGIRQEGGSAPEGGEGVQPGGRGDGNLEGQEAKAQPQEVVGKPENLPETAGVSEPEEVRPVWEALPLDIQALADEDLRSLVNNLHGTKPGRRGAVKKGATRDELLTMAADAMGFTRKPPVLQGTGESGPMGSYSPTEGSREAASPPSAGQGQTPPTEPLSSRMESPEPPPVAATQAMREGAIVAVPTERINVDPGRFQFKANANKAGVVEGEELSGEWNPLAAGVILVWEDKAGKLWAVNGHHRTDLAKRKGVATMDARVVRESAGVTADDARILGAELNILEGQGKVDDYAEFFRNTKIPESEAEQRGLLARRKGQVGFLVGSFSSEDVWSAYRNGKVPAEKAAVIADLGRGDEGLQAAGLAHAKTQSVDQLRHFLQTLKSFPRQKAAKQGDLFGFDDSAIREAEQMSAAADSIVEAKKERLLAVRGALKRPEAATQMGLSGDFQAIQAEVDPIVAEIARWKQWTTDPELVREVRKKAGLDVGPDSGEAPSLGGNFSVMPALISVPENLHPIFRNAVDQVRQLFGHTHLPALARASREVHDAAFIHATSRDGLHVIVRDLLRKTLGDQWQDPAMRQRLAETLNADNLLGVYDAMVAAGNHEGAGKIEKAQDLDALDRLVQTNLKDPAIVQAVENWKAFVNPQLNDLWATVRRLDPEAPQEGRGRYTGARVNLLSEERAKRWTRYRGRSDEPMPPPEVGNAASYRNPDIKRDPFARHATGTSQYSTDLETILTAVYGPRYEQATKIRLYDAMVDSGLAHYESSHDKGWEAPEGFRRMPIESSTTGRPVRDAIWVREDVVQEFRRVIATDLRANPIWLAQALTGLQMVGFMDAFSHTFNMVRGVANSLGATVRGDAIRKWPLIGELDSVRRLLGTSARYWAGDPRLMDRAAELAKIGAMRGQYRHGGRAGEFLHKLDTAARLVMDDFYTDLISRGAEDTVAGRRDFINQLGVYNRRVMGDWESRLRDSGVSAFIVAGKAMNRLAFRAITGNPGFKATSTSAAVQARALQLSKPVLALSMAGLANYLLWGNPNGAPGVRLGAVYLGKDEEGTDRQFDLFQFSGLARGLRLFGAKKGIEDVRQGKNANQIVGDMIAESFQTLAHPYMGPALSGAIKGIFGRQPDLRGTMEARRIPEGGGAQYTENLRAAMESQNPLLYYAARSLYRTVTGQGTPEDWKELQTEGVLRQPTTSLGFTKVAQPRDAAEETAHRLATGRLPEGMTEEEEAKMERKRPLLRKAREDRQGGKQALIQEVRSGQLSIGEAKNLLKKASVSDLEWDARRLTAGELKKVWDSPATPEEKTVLYKIVRSRLLRKQSPGDKEIYRGMVEEMKRRAATDQD